MAYNLSRNSRVFVTTNVDTASGAVATTGMTTLNCFEITVMDGFKFSQNTNQTTVTLSEAGATPIRGQRAFNTSLNPVDITFSTYLRPRLAAGTVTADEKVLWNALLGSVATDAGTYVENGAVTTNTPLTLTVGTTATRATTAVGLMTISGATLVGAVANTYYNIKSVTTAGGSAWQGVVELLTYTAGGVSTFEYLVPPTAAAGATSITLLNSRWDKAAWVDYVSHAGSTTPAAIVTSAASNRNQLLPIGFIFVVDNQTYLIDNCVMDAATVDFGLDAIAMAAWTAKGTSIRPITNPSISAAANPVLSGTITGTATGANSTAAATRYLTNKLSTVLLSGNLFGRTEFGASTAYSIVLTGGSITIANNITYITPANLGVVNVPITYFTGARSISGSMNAYLRTGTSGVNDAGALLTALLSSVSEPKYNLELDIGGTTALTRVEMFMPGVVLGVPSVDVADVISTTITFNAQGATPNVTASTGNTYDIEQTNDLIVRYYSI